MTERNLKQELFYSYYEDMEDGRTTETVDYDCLIGLLGELIDRVEGLETQIKDLQKIAIAQDYRNNLGL
jgi:hypothetical protein